MKTQKNIIKLLILLFCSNIILGQEWKNFKAYQKETGNKVLQNGCWLKKDRLHQSETWKKANSYNLSIENGYLKYKSIKQIRDFYIWFDQNREKQGHEIKWIKKAAFIAGKFSKIENGFARNIILHNKEISYFAREGSKKVFAYAFPELQKLYISSTPIKGLAAKEWDSVYGYKEQCVILEPFYNKLSKKALHKLDKIAKGKGIFCFLISKKTRFTGNITDCKSRFEFGMNFLNN